MMKTRKSIPRLPVKAYIIIAVIIYTALFYFFAGWLGDADLSAELMLFRAGYVIFAPLLTIFLASRLRKTLNGRLQLTQINENRLEKLSIILPVLSFVATVIAIYEFYALSHFFSFFNPFTSGFINEKSLIFKTLYGFSDAGGVATLGISLCNLNLLAILLNGLCWLVYVFFYKPQKILTAVPFINAGLSMASFHCLVHLMWLSFADAFAFEGMLQNLQEGIDYAILGFVCAIVFNASRLYTCFRPQSELDPAD